MSDQPKCEVMTAEEILNNTGFYDYQEGRYIEVRSSHFKEELDELTRTIESVRGRLDPAYTNHYHRGFDIAIDAVLKALGLAKEDHAEIPTDR